MSNKEPGYVYILTNPSFREDWVKIGKSSRPVDVRSKELDNTAVPLPFEIFATMKTVKYNEVEALVHKMIDGLTNLRIRPNREFFNVPPQKALEIFRFIASTIDDAEVTLYQDDAILKSKDSDNKIIYSSKMGIVNASKSEKKDYTHYKLNGTGNYGKGDLALEIIKLFIHDNPRLTFQELKKTIPLQIKTYNEILLWKEKTTDKKKDTRWFEDSNDLMKSADGEIFAFTRMVGKDNIGKMIEFGQEQGYVIEPIF